MKTFLFVAVAAVTMAASYQAAAQSLAQRTPATPAPAYRLGCGYVPGGAFTPPGFPGGLLGLTNTGTTTIPSGAVVAYTLREPGKPAVRETVVVPSLKPGERQTLKPVGGGWSCSVDSIVAPPVR
jgi:hypothetical protein